MNRAQLFHAIGNISEKYIDEAAPDTKPKQNLIWVKFAAAAACICLILLGGFELFSDHSDPLHSLSSMPHPSAVLGTGNVSPNPNQDKSTDEQQHTQSDEVKAPSKSGGATRGEAPNAGKPQQNAFILSNSYIYTPAKKTDCSKFGISANPTFQELGEKLGELTDDNTFQKELVGCEVFAHKQADKNFVIVKANDEFLLFILTAYKTN